MNSKNKLNLTDTYIKSAGEALANYFATRHNQDLCYTIINSLRQCKDQQEEQKSKRLVFTFSEESYLIGYEGTLGRIKQTTALDLCYAIISNPCKAVNVLDHYSTSDSARKALKGYRDASMMTVIRERCPDLAKQLDSSITVRNDGTAIYQKQPNHADICTGSVIAPRPLPTLVNSVNWKTLLTGG